MSLIPTAIKEYFRKTFVGCTLEEVVEELRSRSVTKISLTGDAESTAESLQSPYAFYVHYLAQTKTGETLELKELAGKAYSNNWRKDTNWYLNYRKEVLEKELGKIEIIVKYRSENVPIYS